MSDVMGMDAMGTDEMYILRNNHRRSSANEHKDESPAAAAKKGKRSPKRGTVSRTPSDPWKEGFSPDETLDFHGHHHRQQQQQQRDVMGTTGRSSSLIAPPKKEHDTLKTQRSLSYSHPKNDGGNIHGGEPIPVANASHVQDEGNDFQQGAYLRKDESRGLSHEHVNQLISEGYSKGLAKALAQNALAFNHRIWVIDNSGSMQIGDGHRIAETGKRDDFKAVPATRWEEIQDTVKYHANMAALLDSPTIFKLLNDPGNRIGPQQFSIADKGQAVVQDDIDLAIKTMKRVKPGGVTPLTRHIWEIQSSIQNMVPQLVANGQKVVIVLATDGLPTDEQGYGGEYITDEFVRALKALEGLPVWLVVRLCTDEEPVTRFYNNLDGQLELSLEVLDDFIGEAREVYRHNKWLNYGLPMHRCRELGYHDRLFDLIDERPLTRGEIREFCSLIFGLDDAEDIPDPGADWPGFIREINTLLKGEKLQWNPIKKKLMPWINLKSLNKTYGDGSKCVVM